MSATTPRLKGRDASRERTGSIRSAFVGYVDRLRAGDMGSLPVVAGMALIVAYFTSQTGIFFTATNFDNLIVQMAPLVMIAIGVVFVLLIAEIDLSIGFVSGLGGVCAAWLQEPGSGHAWSGLIVIPVTILFGAAIGLFQGSFVALLGVPSFVVTLAGLLAFQGVIILWIGSQGTIGIEDKWINDVANAYLSTTAGWIVAAVTILGLAASAFGRIVSRRRANLPTDDMGALVLRVVLIGAVTVLAVGIANHARGVPFAGLLVVALLAFWTFIARRTTFGRHVYAVGGNPEAARRAGINVAFIRMVVFMISGGMAALGGIAFAARLNSVDLTAGGGPILLNAIAAAVIGGTSLFGGRGRVVAALLGSLVIMTLANGLSLLGSSAATQYIITGAILLAAVTLDSVSRRRLQTSGR